MVPFSFAGHEFLASPDGALHWPVERALLVADLHLEKASWFARWGQMLPPYDSQATLTARLDWVWIVGNHDTGFVDHCGGRIVDEVEVAGIVLRHEAIEGDRTPEMSGHYHPKLRLNLKGRQVSRRCYVASSTKLILPAYGSLTGGLDAHHPEIVKKVGPGASALVPVTDRLLRFPIAA